MEWIFYTMQNCTFTVTPPKSPLSNFLIQGEEGRCFLKNAKCFDYKNFDKLFADFQTEHAVE